MNHFMQVELWLLITRKTLLAIDFRKEIYVMQVIKISEVGGARTMEIGPIRNW